MNSKLAVGLAMFLSGIGTQLAGVEHGWVDVLTPTFVSGFIIQMSGFIISVWGGLEHVPTRDEKTRTRSTDND